MYVCMCITCMYVCMCITCMYVCMYVYYMYVCMYVYMYVYYMYVCMYVYMYVYYMYVCMYVCIYTRIDIHMYIKFCWTFSAFGGEGKAPTHSPYTNSAANQPLDPWHCSKKMPQNRQRKTAQQLHSEVGLRRFCPRTNYIFFPVRKGIAALANLETLPTSWTGCK